MGPNKQERTLERLTEGGSVLKKVTDWVTYLKRRLQTKRRVRDDCK